MLDRHDSCFLSRFHYIARRGLDGLLVSLLPEGLFCAGQLLFGLCERRLGILFCVGIAGHAHRVAGFKQLQWRIPINAEDGILDLGIRGGIRSPAQEFVGSIDVFHLARVFAHGIVFQHHHIARLRHRKIRFGRHDHPERLHIRVSLHGGSAVFQHHFPQVLCASLRRNGPKNVGQILQAELRGIFQACESCLDFHAIFFALDLGLAGSALHELRSLKMDLYRAPGTPVIHGLGRAGDTVRRASCRDGGGLCLSLAHGRGGTNRQKCGCSDARS